MVVNKSTIVEAVQAASPVFPPSVANSPILFALALFKCLIVSICFITVMIGILRQLRQDGVTPIGSVASTRIKICCLLAMGILATLPKAFLYLLWNEPGVSPRFISALLTTNQVLDSLGLIPFFVFIFYGYSWIRYMSDTKILRGLRWTLVVLGRADLASRMMVDDRSNQFLVIPASDGRRSSSLSDIVFFRVPTVVSLLFSYTSAFVILVTIAKFYRIT